MCMASLAMVSCSDDDEKDDSEVQKSELVGKWVLTNLITEYGGETDTESFKVSEEADVIIFNEDGTCRNYAKWGNEYDWDVKAIGIYRIQH